MQDLIESDELVGTEGVHPYLFSSCSGTVEFVAAEEEMTQLNDFCCSFLRSASLAVADLEKDIQRRTMDPHRVVGHDLGMDITNSEVAWALEEFDLPRWNDTYTFLAPATCLLLVHVFTEKHLRDVCASVWHGQGRPPYERPPRSMSRIDAYLRFLLEEGLQFRVSSELQELVDKTREVRNAFAHGEWDRVRSIIATTSLREAFATVTELFTAIEQAYELRDAGA